MAIAIAFSVFLRIASQWLVGGYVRDFSICENCGDIVELFCLRAKKTY
jgi:hypothetical protein